MGTAVVPDFGWSTHLAQGQTLQSVLVELNVPPGCDKTAAYVSLSRIRNRKDLYILRNFKRTSLRRHHSKASVDILLQKLRGELDRNAHGCKECLSCNLVKPRRDFINATGDTVHWTGPQRWCVKCQTKCLAEHNNVKRQRAKKHTCITCKTEKPWSSFTNWSGCKQCKECVEHQTKYAVCCRCCKDLRRSEFSDEQLHHNSNNRVCNTCAVSNEQKSAARDFCTLQSSPGPVAERFQ